MFDCGRRPTDAQMEARGDLIVELTEQHHPCSIRNVFYRCVAAGATKSDSTYNKVQRGLVDLRRAGRVPYHWIVDGSRTMFGPGLHEDANALIRDMHGAYKKDLWQYSDHRVEVWCESDSIRGVIHGTVVHEHRVPLFPTRGQPSESFVWLATQEWSNDSRTPVVLYVGDHDPAGLEIDDALVEKANRMSNMDFVFRRIAVTPGQIDEFDLPRGQPPKKKFDSDFTVEAEALPPNNLRQIVADEIVKFIDPTDWNFLLRQEQRELAGLAEMAEAGFGGAG